MHALPVAGCGRRRPSVMDAHEHPVLINRPIVVTPLGVRLRRPSETVLSLLTREQDGAFNKEDGGPVVDDQGRRVDKGNVG